jgi:hypothetical protein
VTHPLQSLRFYIRSYVTIEGTLLLLLYLACCFWAGLAFDYGFFKLAGLLRLRWIDWVELLPWGFRTVMLCFFVLGMLAVVGFKVISRLFREFRDGALALVLERRFPHQLGDRLITAVELADPRLAKRYGYSQAMVDHTVQDAADRVEKLPVRQVFNWGRLVVYGIVVVLLTVGLYLAVGLVYCILAGRGPVDFMVRFHHVASIWFERNILLMDTYWPRRTQLELLAPEFPDDPTTLHHNRNEPLPPVRVRAVKWVLDDTSDRAQYPLGWRPLRYRDLTPELLGARVPEGQRLSVLSGWPAEWEKTWSVDQMDLQLRKPDVERTLADARILQSVQSEMGNVAHREKWRDLKWADLKAVWPAEVLGDQEAEDAVKPVEVRPTFWPADWQDRWTLGQVEKQFQTTEGSYRSLCGTIGLAGAGPLEVMSWVPLRREQLDAVARTCADAAVYRSLHGVLSQLGDRAESPWMERRLRKLVIPQTVMLYYEGASMDGSGPLEKRENNEYYGTFRNDVHESIRFTVNGEDFYTPYKRIELVPPPRLVKLTREEFQPAYIYHRTPGHVSPDLLKGKKHLLHNLDVPGDDRPVISVPAGTTLVLTAEADKDLRDVRIEWRVTQPATEGPAKDAKRIEEVHVLEPDQVPIQDNRRFEVRFDNVTKPILVDFEFTDTTRLKGRRQIQIQPLPDAVPVVDVQVEVLRKTNQGYLITASNLIPFSGKVTDDHGLTRLEYEFTVTALQSQTQVPVTASEGVSALQLVPAGPGQQWVAPAYLMTWLRSHTPEPEPAEARPIRLPLATFQDLLRDAPAADLPLAVLLPDLQEGPILPQIEDALYDLRGVQDRLKQLGEQLNKVEAEDVAALAPQTIQIQEMVSRNRDRVREAQENLRTFRAALEKKAATKPELLTKLDKWVLAPIEAAFKEFDAVQSATSGLHESLQAGKRDQDDVAESTQHLDKLREQLSVARDGLQNDPGRSLDKFKDFKLEYDKNFDPRRGEPTLEGFDLKKHLSFLKQRDENKPQLHYRIQMQLLGTDNNIETAPGVGKSRETFTFLVVSDNELLNDIGKEEESLRLKLEDAIAILQDSRLKLGRASSEMQGLKSGDDFRDVAKLTEDTKEDVSKSGDKVREVHTDYKRILEQMKFGRVPAQWINRVDDGICTPLDLALTREFVQVDEALSDLYTTMKSANPDVKAAEDARVKLDALIARLNKVLDSMRQITTINLLIEKLVKIEKSLREQNEVLAVMERKKIEDLLNKLNEPMDKPK